MLSGGPHQLIKDNFVLAKMPLNVHMQNEEVKLDKLLFISSLLCVNDRIIYTIVTFLDEVILVLV